MKKRRESRKAVEGDKMHLKQLNKSVDVSVSEFQ
jgi:hypothetical protein